MRISEVSTRRDHKGERRIYDVCLPQVKNNFRSSITIPEKSWARFRDVFVDYVDKMQEATGSASTSGGNAGDASRRRGPRKDTRSSNSGPDAGPTPNETTAAASAGAGAAATSASAGGGNSSGGGGGSGGGGNGNQSTSPASGNGAKGVSK